MPDFEIKEDGSIVFVVEPAALERAIAQRGRQLGLVDKAGLDELYAELFKLRAFARDVMNQLPGITNLDEAPPLIRQLRLMPADQAVLIKLSYWRNRAMELAEERDIYRKRAEGCPPVERAKLFGDPPPSSWQGRDPKMPKDGDDVADHGSKPPVLPRPPAQVIQLHSDQGPEASDSEIAHKTSEPNEVLCSTTTAQGDSPPPPAAPNLRVVREQLGLSQVSLAQRLGKTQSQISLYERHPLRCPQELYERAQLLLTEVDTPQNSPTENEQNNAPPRRFVDGETGYHRRWRHDVLGRRRPMCSPDAVKGQTHEDIFFRHIRRCERGRRQEAVRGLLFGRRREGRAEVC